MFGLKLDKSVRISDVMVLIGGLSAGWGMYYATQARIDGESAERKLAEHKAAYEIEAARGDVSGLSESVVEVVNAVRELREQQADLRTDVEVIKARSGS